MAIDIEHFCDLDDFKKTAGEILRSLRNSQKAPGKKRIYTCGEKEHLAWCDRKEKGTPVDQTLQQQLIQMRDEQNLTQYRFPFEA
jgi:LDH2 family malate/lactate/ureidoglycolate dehydrogenase